MLPEKFYYKKDRLNQIRGFCNVVRFGSINNASKELNLEPATISKQILTLERDIKIELFDRTNKRRLILNKFGEEFYKKSVEILQNIDGLFKHFYNDINSVNNNEIRIAATHTAICFLLPQYIKEFQKENKDIKFTIFNIPFLESKNKIINEKVDLAIWTSNELSSEFVSKEIYNFKSSIIMNKNNLLSKKKDLKITYANLKKQNILMMDKYDYMDLFSEIIKIYNLSGNIKFFNGDWESIRNFVKLNLGIHFYSEIYNKFNILEDKDIVLRDISNIFPNISYKLITKNGKIFNDNIQKFLCIINNFNISVSSI